MNGVWAVLPVKGFGRGKSRLADVLPAPTRASLARRMFEGVMQAVGACPGVEGILVATESDEVAELVRPSGARVIRDHPDRSHNLGEVVDAALNALRAESVERAVVLMCDLPLLKRADVEELLRFDEAMVVAPDGRQEGTNALVLSLGSGVATRFGRRGSFSAHLELARDAGLSVATFHNTAFAFDLDTSSDLTELQAPSAAFFPRLLG